MAPNYDVTWAEAPCVRCCVQLTHGIARWSRYEGAFLLIWCQTTPWYGAAGIAQHPSLHDARNSRLRPCFAEKSQIVTQNTQQRTVDCAPSNFVRSVLPS